MSKELDRLEIIKMVENRELSTQEALKLIKSLHKKIDPENAFYYSSYWKEAPGKESGKLSGKIVIIDSNNKLHNIIKNLPEIENCSLELVTDNLPIQGNEELTIIFNLFSESPDENSKTTSSILERHIFPLISILQTLITNNVKCKIACIYKKEPSNQQAPLFAALSGMAKSLMKEQRNLTLKVIGTTTEINRDFCKNILLELSDQVDNTIEIDYIDNKRYIKLIKEQKGSNSSSTLLKKNGVYLITGGLGGLGLIFAKYLSDKYEANLILSGRSPISEKNKETLKQLERGNNKAIYLRADLTDKNAVIHLLSESKKFFPEINGVIHSAGIKKDSFFRKKSVDDFKSVFGPKIFGTINIDDATKNEPLDFFILFSSLSSIVGNIGQTDYSYANSFLDNYTLYREEMRSQSRCKGKTLSFNWSLWAEGGMQVDKESQKFLSDTLGVKPLPTATGINAFEYGLGLSDNQLIVAAGEKEKIDKIMISTDENLPTLPTKSLTDKSSISDKLIKLISTILKIDSKEIDIYTEFQEYGFDSVSMIELANKINRFYEIELTPAIILEYNSIQSISSYLLENYNLGEDKKQEQLLSSRVENELKMLISKALKIAVNDLTVDCEFNDFGFDSVSLTELSNKLNSLYKIELSPAIILENPTINSLNHHLCSEWQSELTKYYRPLSSSSASQEVVKKNTITPEVTTSPISNKVVPNSDEEFAIIGMAGIFPGAENIYQFWDNLTQAKCNIRELPKDRVDYSILKDYSTLPAVGGFIEDIESFDHKQFNITKEEAVLIDPQQRLFLETAYTALHNAGYNKDSLNNMQCGVYVGIPEETYKRLIIEHGESDKEGALENAQFMAASRVSHTFNLKGPAITMNSACSSSIAALHLATQALRNKDCSMALVGGVELQVGPYKLKALNEMGALSKSGKSLPCDSRSDGLVIGEAVGAVVIKPLSQAIKDQDFIYSIIKGSALNNDGHTKIGMIPNVEAQKEVIQQVVNKTGIDISRYGYYELHGVSTKMGDAIELSAIKKVWLGAKEKDNNKKCILGTHKANIGHTLAASGIVSLIKSSLMLTYKKLIPMLENIELSTVHGLKDTPFTYIYKLLDWEVEKNEKRYIGINAFGFGGTNSHVLLEEYRENQLSPPDSLPKMSKTKHWFDQKALPIASHTPPPAKKTDSSIKVLPELNQQVIAFILETIAKEANINTESIDTKTSFNELGIDSVVLNNLLLKFEKQIGVSLSPLMLLETEGIEDFAEQLIKGFKEDMSRHFGESTGKVEQTKPDGLNSKVITFILETIAKEANIKTENIDTETSFNELGIDSVVLNNLLLKFEKQIGVSLSPLMLLETEGIEDFAAQLIKGFKEDMSRHFGESTGKVEQIKPDGLNSKVITFILETIAKEANINTENIDTKTSFNDLGIDSVVLNNLLLKFEKQIGVSLSPLMLLETEGIEDFAEQLIKGFKEDMSRHFGESTGKVEQTKPDGLNSKVITFILETIAKEANINTESIDTKTSFNELGIDSVVLNNLLLKFEKQIGVSLSPLMLLETEGIEDFAAQLIKGFNEDLINYFKI